MILYIVILLICVNKIYSDESEEGKYIDLLPEDEKREFLEKVARRILEEVKSKDIVQKSVELSDGQLNKHSSYVSQVMKEESNDIIKKHGNDTNVKKKDVRSDGSVVKNLDKTDSVGRIENNEKNGYLEHIDLTLRQGKASIREHETEKRTVADTLDPKDKPSPEESTTIYTVTEESTKPSITQETNTQIKVITTENKKKDDNISIEITVNSNNTNKQIDSSNFRLQPSNDINIPVQVFYDGSQNDYKQSLKYNVQETSTNTPMTTEDVKPDGAEYIYQSREENGHNDETRKTVTVMENYEPKKCWSSEESSKTLTSTLHTTTINKNLVTDESQRVVTNCDGKPIKIETTSQWIIVDPPDVTGGIYELIDMTRSKKTNDSDIDQKVANGIIMTTEASINNFDTSLTILDVVNSTVNNRETVKEEESTTGVIVNTTYSYKDVTIEKIPEILATTVEFSTIGIPATAKPEMLNLENTEKSLNSEKPEKHEFETPTILISSTKNRFQEIKLKSSSLRLGDVETQLPNSQKNLMELESMYNEHKIKELKVYEIPPGQPLFVNNQPNIPKDLPKISDREIISEGRLKNSEQPNYVPIYNYSPNNAYFNAYNRLGPNYEDEEVSNNSDAINSNVLRIKADNSISFESREKFNKKYYFYDSRPIIKKIRSKILLPPSMPKYKKKKYNPQIHLDDYSDTEEDTYFRKEKMHKKYTRNRYKKEKKNKQCKDGQSDEESMQVDEMYVKGTIKNHIDAVRNYLSKKNYFQFYDSPTAAQEKIKNKKNLSWKKPEKAKDKKNDKLINKENINKDRGILNVPKEHLDRLKNEGLDRVKEEGEKIKDEALEKVKEEGERIKEEGLDRVKEAVDIEHIDSENKDKKRRKKLKRLLRAQGATRYGKSKPNKRPKTGTVDGFHNRPPKYGHGIDLDYYFGRTGPDVSSSRELLFSSSEESSIEKGPPLIIEKLGNIYYSKLRKNYGDYRRNKNNQEIVDSPGDGDNSNNDKPSADQAPKKENSGDTQSKFSMADFNLVKNISVASDLVPNVLMMQKLLGISERSGDNNNLNHYLTALSDMIEMDNKALLRYDWLGSAVDIQSALRKLTGLTEQLNDGDFGLHPSDWELFKYVFYIYETVDLDEKKKLVNKRKMLHPEIPLNRIKEYYRWEREPLKLLPKSKHAGPKKLKKYAPYFGLRSQMKLYAEKLREKKKLLKNILNFQEFLNSVLDNLNDLHDAIKHIGMVSKQNTVKWFKNLKEIYLNNPRKKELLSTLLHLSMNRVVNLIEESATEGVERSFVSYVKRGRNASKIKWTKEEVSFVLSILRELEKLEN